MSLDRAPKQLSTHEVASEEKKPHGRYEKRSSYTLMQPSPLQSLR